MSNSPIGSLAMQGPSLTPQVITVNASTCTNLSLFKDLLKEYRALDDSITMRFNRATAAMRDKDRESSPGNRPPSSTVQDQACLYIWRDLMSSWARRARLIDYCVDVVDKTHEQKRASAEAAQTTSQEPRAVRKAQAEQNSADLQRRQMHDEIAIEKIVRQRSIQGE